MGLSNPLHIMFLLVIMLLVFGAKRLPEMGKSLGEGLRGFKSAIDGETSHEIAHITAVPVQTVPAPVQAATMPAQDAQTLQPTADAAPAPLTHS